MLQGWAAAQDNDETKWAVLDIEPDSDTEPENIIITPFQLEKPLWLVSANIHASNVQDVTLIILLHMALLWFLTSNWQAADKAEQLRQLQQPLQNKVQAFLYRASNPSVRPVAPSAEAAFTIKRNKDLLEEPVADKPQSKPSDKPASVAQKVAPENPISAKPFNYRAATKSYFQQAQQRPLQQLQSQSERYRYGSVSEMTPQMQQQWLPERETFAEKKTLDHQFDPNRVYRFGSTCMRVVKIIDPIAGDSENLGYKFKCGQTDQEKALAASLDKYTKKRK